MNKEREKVELGDWITIGEGMPAKNVVVCQIYDDDQINADIEVVYIDGSRAINENVVWKNSHWEFEHEGPSGGYADNYSRLSEFVAILRQGRRFK